MAKDPSSLFKMFKKRHLGAMRKDWLCWGRPWVAGRYMRRPRISQAPGVMQYLWLSFIRGTPRTTMTSTRPWWPISAAASTASKIHSWGSSLTINPTWCLNLHSWTSQEVRNWTGRSMKHGLRKRSISISRSQPSAPSFKHSNWGSRIQTARLSRRKIAVMASFCLEAVVRVFKALCIYLIATANWRTSSRPASTRATRWRICSFVWVLRRSLCRNASAPWNSLRMPKVFSRIGRRIKYKPERPGMTLISNRLPRCEWWTHRRCGPWYSVKKNQKRRGFRVISLIQIILNYLYHTCNMVQKRWPKTRLRSCLDRRTSTINWTQIISNCTEPCCCSSFSSSSFRIILNT